MRYQVLASDYDGTLASHGCVSPATLDQLRALKATGRRLVLVTGREMKDLVLVIPSLAEGEICIWRLDSDQPPYKTRYRQPKQLMQRHKKKYATGDMGDNSFVFTGPDGRLHLVANNLMLFAHIARGIPDHSRNKILSFITNKYTD